MLTDEEKLARAEEVGRLARRRVETLKESRSLRYWRRGGEPVVSVIDRKTPGGWEVGYSWSRPCAHHLSGIVHECVLAHGLTRDHAIRRATRRIAQREQRVLFEEVEP